MTPELPRITEAALAPADLDAYARELQSSARIQEIRLKSAAQSLSTRPADADLACALAALRSGAARALQLLYTLDGEPYCDTLVPAPEGQFRLVRRHPTAPTTPTPPRRAGPHPPR